MHDIDAVVGNKPLGGPQEGWDTTNQIRVAVKTTSAAKAQREFAVTRGLVHPHLVCATRVALGERDQAYLVTPLIAARPLASFVGIDVGLRRIAFDCLDALACMHRHGYLHKDLHHGNILTDGASACIIDFETTERSASAGARAAELHKMLGFLAMHATPHAARDVRRLATSRLIRRWPQSVPSREKLRRHALFRDLHDLSR